MPFWDENTGVVTLGADTRLFAHMTRKEITAALAALAPLPAEFQQVTGGPMALAFEEGFALGYRDFAMYGADGGRLDHTLANLQLLGGVSRRGANVRMVGNGFDMLRSYL